MTAPKNGLLHRVRNFQDQCRLLWRESLWPMDLAGKPRVQAILIRGLRLTQLVIASVRKHRLFGLAASLTFTTLLSLIPMVALGLSLLKGLGFQREFLERIQPFIESLPNNLAAIAEKILEMVQETDFAQLGGLGALLLVFMSVQLLHRMEGVFNGIWGVKTKRRLLRRMTNYISILVVVPLLGFTALTMFAQSAWRDQVLASPVLTALAMFFLLSLAFAFFYRALTNARIQWFPLWTATIVSTLLFLAWFYVYLTIQPGLNRYNILYGTLASVPIFLIWLNSSWLIVLLGFEIAYAVQHEKTVPTEFHHSISPRAQIGVAMALMMRAIQAFEKGRGSLDIQEFAEEHGIPAHTIRTIATRLVEAEFLAETASSEDRLLLGKPSTTISQASLANLILDHDPREYPLDYGPNGAMIESFLAEFDRVLAQEFAQKSLNDLGT